MSFLKAEWRKLIMMNYEVNPEVLQAYVPPGTELDYFENKCYVSLIGFLFANTKLLGLKIPFHVNFEEVNLRFYVKRKDKDTWKRGVVFIKEIVPKPAITFVANTLYNENYQTLPMKHAWEVEEDKIAVDYQWKTNTKWNKISVLAENKQIAMAPNSVIEFIAEHYWGYAKNGLKTTEYEVTHPSWKYYPVLSSKIEVNFEETYGSEFKLLQDLVPDSVFLLEGSEITIEGKTILG